MEWDYPSESDNLLSAPTTSCFRAELSLGRHLCADEAFFEQGTFARQTPVAMIDGRQIGDGEMGL